MTTKKILESHNVQVGLSIFSLEKLPNEDCGFLKVSSIQRDFPETNHVPVIVVGGNVWEIEF